MKPLTIKKHTKPGECQISGCRNATSGRKMCSTCRARKTRQADPVRYAYNNLKNRAKQRGILFTITLQQFREFCIKTQYIDNKGRASESFTIDRIHDDIGYHADNIQVLTSRENILKYKRYDSIRKKAVDVTPVEPQFENEDLLF